MRDLHIDDSCDLVIEKLFILRKKNFYAKMTLAATESLNKLLVGIVPC